MTSAVGDAMRLTCAAVISQHWQLAPFVDRAAQSWCMEPCIIVVREPRNISFTSRVQKVWGLEYMLLW